MMHVEIHKGSEMRCHHPAQSEEKPMLSMHKKQDFINKLMVTHTASGQSMRRPLHDHSQVQQKVFTHNMLCAITSQNFGEKVAQQAMQENKFGVRTTVQAARADEQICHANRWYSNYC